MFNRLAVIATGAAMSILVVIVAFPAQAGGPGSDIVAMGGGYIEEAEFVQGGPRDVTFSFFVGFDRHNEVKGAFQYKDVVPGDGATVGFSTHITVFEDGADTCPWVQMDGTMTFHGHWAKKPSRGEYFRIKAWDCEGLGLPDSVQIWVWRKENQGQVPPGKARMAQWLDGRTELTGGNVIIREPFTPAAR
jgi:hypothetical protein